MLIVAKKIHPAKLAAGCIAAALFFTVGGMGMGLARHVRAVETAGIIPMSQNSPEVTLRNNADRVAYLEKRGWVVGQEPVAEEDILIPEAFSADYNEYLALQESQGFDLRAHSGQTVKRYTYAVKNYPGLQENIWVCLLIHRKTVIGGEVYCCEGDGFTQGLDYPARASLFPDSSSVTAPDGDGHPAGDRESQCPPGQTPS